MVIGMTDVKETLQELIEDPQLKRVHDEQADIVHVARLIRSMRAHAGLTQAQLAAEMQTTQSQIARLESFDNKSKPNLDTLQAVAHACGQQLLITAVPIGEVIEQTDAVAL